MKKSIDLNAYYCHNRLQSINSDITMKSFINNLLKHFISLSKEGQHNFIVFYTILGGNTTAFLYVRSWLSNNSYMTLQRKN